MITVGGELKTIIIKDIYKMMKQGQLRVPPYQRNYVWNEEQRALLIDSVLKGHYIGQMVLAKTDKADCYDIIDGQQRLKTIYYFIENGFRIKNDKKGLDDTEQTEFLNKALHFYITYEVPGTEQITEIFRLINTTGEPLKRQEIRRISGKGAFAEAVSSLTLELYPQKVSLQENEANPELDSSCIWHRLGVFTKKKLLQMEDEDLIARIILSVLYNKQQMPDDKLVDAAYNENSKVFSEINGKLADYPSVRLISQIKSVFAVLNTVSGNVECFSKTGFYITFLALYDVMVNELKQIECPDALTEIFNDINALVADMQETANIRYEKWISYAKFHILQNCFENDASCKISLLKNALENYKVETAKYEFKQGFLRLSEDRRKDGDLKKQILETICGMANAAFTEPAYLFIGIADKESDAVRISTLDNIAPARVAEHYIVGIEREARIMGVSVDEYCTQIKDFIDKSDMSEALQLSVLSNMELITYHGFSVVCIVVPPQKEMSYLGDNVFIRKHSSTTQVTNPREIIAIFNNLSQNKL